VAPLPPDRSAIPTLLYGSIPVERDTTTDDIYDMLLSGEQ